MMTEEQWTFNPSQDKDQFGDQNFHTFLEKNPITIKNQTGKDSNNNYPSQRSSSHKTGNYSSNQLILIGSRDSNDENIYGDQYMNLIH